MDGFKDFLLYLDKHQGLNILRIQQKSHPLIQLGFMMAMILSGWKKILQIYCFNPEVQM